VLEYDSRSKGAEAYRDLARELIKNQAKTTA
jgi:cellulose biosynthesis protein BcsQ